MAQTPKIVVVGSINVDFILTLDALPRPNETLLGRNSAKAIGGKGLNQAVACARSGIETHMVAAIGDDALGGEALAFLTARGVSTAQVRALKDTATGIANILVASNGENMIVVSPEANGKLTPAMVDAAQDLIASASAVVVQLETPLDSVKRALEIARQHGVLTILNPAPVDMAATALFALADVVTPNETELAKLTGISGLDDASLTKALQALVDLGARQALATQGEQGSAALIDGQLHRLLAFRVQAVDATGAGDIFNGALASQLVRGVPLLQAMRYASAASALSVTKASADSAPSEAEVQAFLKAQS